MSSSYVLPSKGDYVQGSFIRPPSINGTIVSRNPGDLDHVVGAFPHTPDSVDSAVNFARQALPSWRQLPLEERLSRLGVVADQLLQITDEMANFVTCEVGKPIWESRMEVLAAVRQCDILLKESPPLLAPMTIEPIHGSCRRRPLGVVAAIAPATVPVYVPTGFILSALVAGNTVVLNPSSRTPAVGQLIAEVVDRSGLPRGVFNMVQGPGELAGAALAAHPEVDAVAVAGHRRTSRSVVAAAESQVRKRVISQTGGKGTAVVLEHADLDRAAYEIATGAFLTTGQRFNSTARAVVEDAVYDRFRERLLHVIPGLRIGYGFDDVFMGPVLGNELRQEVIDRVGVMEQAGTRVALRGDIPSLSRPGHYLQPTVLEHGERVANSVVPEEVPGPVLALERTSSREETWIAADRMTYGLAASVFSTREQDFEEASHSLHVGTLNWNRATVAASGRLPFASWGRAGKGSEGNVYLARALSHPTSMLVDPEPFDPTNVMPGVAWPLEAGRRP